MLKLFLCNKWNIFFIINIFFLGWFSTSLTWLLGMIVCVLVEDFQFCLFRVIHVCCGYSRNKIYKSLHRKLKIKQHESHLKPMNLLEKFSKNIYLIKISRSMYDAIKCLNCSFVINGIFFFIINIFFFMGGWYLQIMPPDPLPSPLICWNLFIGPICKHSSN
jgi:hypothetical protein